MATLPATLNYQLIEGTFHSPGNLEQIEPYLCHRHGAESFNIYKRFRRFLAGFRNAQLPDVGGWDIRSKAEWNREYPIITV